MHSLKPFLAACLLAMAPALAQAPGDVRVALVIGNGAYAGSAALPNPANDATAMTTVLKQLGFEVLTVRDGTREQMLDATKRLRELMQGKQAVGMVYYAGHGLQVDWRNYMVPVDAQLRNAQDVPQQAIDVTSVVQTLRDAGSRMNILVLDACRDNPFPQASTAKGLAQLDAPPGTILAYATAPGNVAQDGTGNNGLYTQFLLQELVRPHARIEEVFKRTRFAVRKASEGRQVPWESTSLEEEFVFNDGRSAGTPGTNQQPAPSAVSVDTANLAAQRAHWERIKETREPAQLLDFLRLNPSGGVSELAAARLDILDAPKIRPQPDQTGQQLSYTRRYIAGDLWEFRTRDGLTNLDMAPWTIRVHSVTEEKADLEQVSPFGRIRSQSWHDGRVDVDPHGKYDPAYPAMPAGLMQVGKSWKAQSVLTRQNGERDNVTIAGKIVARESIVLPAGTFDVYRVELAMQYALARTNRKVTLWIEPNERLAVKLLNEERGDRGAPTIVVRELVKRTRAS